MVTKRNRAFYFQVVFCCNRPMPEAKRLCPAPPRMHLSR